MLKIATPSIALLTLESKVGKNLPCLNKNSSQDWVAFMSQPYRVEVKVEVEVDIEVEVKLRLRLK